MSYFMALNVMKSYVIKKGVILESLLAVKVNEPVKMSPRLLIGQEGDILTGSFAEILEKWWRS